MVKVCECCGHPVPEFNTLRGLTPAQQKLFAVLDAAGQRGISRHKLMHEIYGHLANGGPEFMGTLNVQRTKMKSVLDEHGLRIVTIEGRLWRLEKAHV